MGLPLHVILIGNPVNTELIERMVYAANGKVTGSHIVQELSELLREDGIHLSHTICRLEPERDQAQVSAIVAHIGNPAMARLNQALVAGLALVVIVVIGVGVRSFPASGDREVLEMWKDLPYHIAIDRWRRLPTGVPSWSWRGCSLIESSKDAVATFALIEGKKDFPPNGLNLDRLGPVGRELIRLPIPALHERLEALKRSDDEKQMKFAIELDDRGRRFNPDHAKKLLTTPPPKRRKLDGGEFLMAKVHLLHNQTLYSLLSEAQVKCNIYGTDGISMVLTVGRTLSLGPYSLRVEELAPGCRKHFRMTLTYTEAPSHLWLKLIIPNIVQKLLRFRRKQERAVA